MVAPSKPLTLEPDKRYRVKLNRAIALGKRGVTIVGPRDKLVMPGKTIDKLMAGPDADAVASVEPA